MRFIETMLIEAAIYGTAVQLAQGKIGMAEMEMRGRLIAKAEAERRLVAGETGLGFPLGWVTAKLRSYLKDTKFLNYAWLADKRMYLH